MRARIAVVAALVSVLLAGVTGPTPAVAAPPGYAVEQTRAIGPGVRYERLVRSGGPVVAHVVRAQGNPAVRFQAVLSNDRVGGPPPISERTSDMCKRVRCIAALNGDFSLPGSGQPVGGFARDGRVLRSPVPHQDQVSVGPTGGLAAGPVGWSGQLELPGLAPLGVAGLNRERIGDGVFIYTPAYGLSTGTSGAGAELVVRLLEVPLPLGLGQTAVVELVSLADGGSNTAIPAGGAVLSAQGTGAASLRALWAAARSSLLGARGQLRLQATPAVVESVGGGPILLRTGAVAVADDGSDFVAGRHPRTVVGWNATETFLVAVDGRQPGYSVGLTLPEAAALLAGLGATDAINLDGGGSTTLSVGGNVVNRPSDRLVRTPGGQQRIVAEPGPGDTVLGPVERPVANAFTIVPAVSLPILAELMGPLLLQPGPGVAPVDPGNDSASAR